MAKRKKEPRLTDDLKSVFSDIEKRVKTITNKDLSTSTTHFMYAVLTSTTSVAGRMLDKTMVWDTKRRLILGFYEMIEGLTAKSAKESGCSKYMYAAFERKADDINSGDLLLMIMKEDSVVKNALDNAGVSYEQLNNAYINDTGGEYSVSQNPLVKQDFGHKSSKAEEKGVININEEAEYGWVQHVFGRDDIYQRIFDILAKKDYNNVILTGAPGVGKTSTAKHIANMLVSGDVPNTLKGKVMITIPYNSLAAYSSSGGYNFEIWVDNISEKLIRNGNYILLIDNAGSLLKSGKRFSDVSFSESFGRILKDGNVPIVMTCSEKDYRSAVESDKSLSDIMTKVHLTDIKEAYYKEIVMSHKIGFERYHNVEIPEEVVDTAIRLCSERGASMPNSAISILDEASAHKKNTCTEASVIEELEEKLDKIRRERSELADNGSEEEIDRITKREVVLKTRIKLIKKDELLSNVLILTNDDVKAVIEQREDGGSIVKADGGLSDLEEKMNNVIIGQEEAVNKVCMAIKRKSVGLGREGKPSVMLFVGYSGTGKTFTAKKLSEYVFGSESSMVRIDMSEYGDKISVNRLYGSAPGYVGYENGGELTEKIKENGRRVLLLDEFEKAHESVHDVFLQVFDEGRLTDNKGMTVDFKDTIIILTSNVGTKEASEYGNGIGFTGGSISHGDIILKNIKKRFKPELINRFDNIILFNKLSEEDLKKVVRIEVDKIAEKVRTIGYKLSNRFIEEAVNEISSSLPMGSEYGARPIIRLAEEKLTNPLTNIILKKNYAKGHVFNSFGLLSKYQ